MSEYPPYLLQQFTFVLIYRLVFETPVTTMHTALSFCSPFGEAVEQSNCRICRRSPVRMPENCV